MQMPRPAASHDLTLQRQGPRVIYFTRTDLPSRKANSIQSMNTCWEMARQGAEVVLVVQQLTRSRRECFEFYGLPDEPRLRLVSLSLPIQGDFNDWKGKTFRAWLSAFLRRWATPGSVVFSRDPAGLELMRAVESLDLPVPLKTVFEVHKVSFMVKASHQVERGRSLEHPKVAARVESRRQLEEEVYENADGILCTSESARRIVEEQFNLRGPIRVVPNGTRIPKQRDGTPLVSSELCDDERDIDVLYVGQLYQWKGVDLLVRAMKQLPGRKLEIVGGNITQDLDRVRDLIHAEGLADRVTLHGYIPPGEVRSFLRRARVGIIPLPQQGYVEATLFTSPLKLFELWQEGVPVVASGVPSICELAENGKQALLVEPDSIAALAAGIHKVLEDRQLAASMVASAADTVTDYSWEKRAQQILDFISSLETANE